MLQSLAQEPVGRLLAQLGFWRRPSHWPLMVYANPQSVGHWEERGGFDAKNWILTRADVDTDW